ncbi:hypothetical protein DNTS_006323 [Danionella cerebrum]|uniref:Uncharacterized protein n=1 Tax=Danionella cerebrum TaxID=2873325 RepID=A0A553QTA2_9TELE|nr:hypothetical protein DNTS_006323 [Danionella translucida]
MSDSETAAPAETPVPAPCAAIKADLDKWVYCTESSTFPAFPAAHGTGLNDGVWQQRTYLSLPFSAPPVNPPPPPFMADCNDRILRVRKSS